MLGDVIAEPPMPTASPSGADYQAALLADAQAFQQALAQLSMCYAEHRSQPGVWGKLMNLCLLFMQKHSTAPFLGGYCKHCLNTVMLLCWLHVKQAWDEACKVKVHPRDDWPEMYSRLSDIMHCKTWAELYSQTDTFMQRYRHTQPVSVQYLSKNWFCAVWLSHWVAAARRFQHSAHNTNLPIEKFHDILKHYYFKVS